MTATAELVGREAGATFSGAEGAAIGTTLYGRVAQAALLPVLTSVKRFYDVADRLTVRSRTGTITLGFTVASMTPVPPSGTAAVLVVYLDAARSKSLTFSNAILSEWRLGTTTAGESEPQRLSMTFRVTASGTAGKDPTAAA